MYNYIISVSHKERVPYQNYGGVLEKVFGDLIINANNIEIPGLIEVDNRDAHYSYLAKTPARVSKKDKNNLVDIFDKKGWKIKIFRLEELK